MRKRDRDPEERLQALLTLQSLLAKVSRELGPAIELQPVLATVLRVMRSLVDFRGGSVCLVEDGVIRVAAADPPVSPEVAAARLPVGRGIVGRTVAECRGLTTDDLIAALDGVPPEKLHSPVLAIAALHDALSHIQP